MASSPDRNPRDPRDPPQPADVAARGATRLFRCRTRARPGFRQEHRIRDLPPFGPAPGDADGMTNAATWPHPSELLLAALGACLVAGIHANAAARAIPISRLELELSGAMNFGALWGAGDAEVAPIGFEAIGVTAHIEADAPRRVLQKLVDHVLLWSPVANSLHNPVTLTATIAER